MQETLTNNLPIIFPIGAGVVKAKTGPNEWSQKKKICYVPDKV
jgi:hypothetical protein